MADAELDITGAVATLRLNRPERRNATTPEMWQLIDQHLATVEADDGVRALVVTGAGVAFCAGADVGGGLSGSADDARERLRRSQQVVLRLHRLPKPVVAAVRGPAVGCGLSIALCCDFIVASDSARFSYAFTRLGLLGDTGALLLLAQRVGLVRAKELVYSGRFFSGAEALAWGIASHQWADAAFDQQVQVFAADLGTGPPRAIAASKQLLQRSWPDLETYLAEELAVAPRLAATDDAREGVAALKDKRVPRFTGR